MENEIINYKNALDQSSIVAITDISGTIIYANDNLCTISKYSRGELTGQSHRIINSGHHSKAFFTNLWKTISSGEIWKGELKNKAKDETTYWVDTTIVPFLDKAGKPYQYIAIGSDITVRKESEHKLKEYQHFFNSHTDMFGIANSVGYFDQINDTFCRELGYSMEELYKTPFIELVHPDDVAPTAREYEKITSGQAELVINFINRYRKKDGSYIWLDWNSTPDKISGKIYCIARNITPKIKAEEALKLSIKETHDYKYALDESSIVAITNTKGVIIHANENFCKISKYSHEELIGQDHRIINSGYHSKEFIRNLWVTIANGNIWRGELMNKAKDGTLYWMETSIVPFLDERGKPYQYIAIRSDITDRKKVEELLMAVNKELEAFSYSVSHDLRTPLRAVTGYARMLNEKYKTQLDEEAKRIINNISFYGKQMGQLVDDLLTFSRIGRKDLVQARVNMKNLVSEVKDELMSMQAGRNIEFRISPLEPALGDKTIIKQVWINLISNAIKYSEKKEKAIIEIGCTPVGNQIRYYIKDNGAGFDMDYAHKLFGVFQRLHSDEEFEGTGIGLALVQRIISRHGGTIGAEGKVGEGAIFHFTLNKP